MALRSVMVFLRDASLNWHTDMLAHTVLQSRGEGSAFTRSVRAHWRPGRLLVRDGSETCIRCVCV